MEIQYTLADRQMSLAVKTLAAIPSSAGEEALSCEHALSLAGWVFQHAELASCPTGAENKRRIREEVAITSKAQD